jgi:3-oxoacyl-[acyl-carrier protein] reductase
MDLGITGKKAIINGGSAGLGKGSALALAREGVDLFVSARGEERLVAACREIADETGVTVTPIVADHSTDDGRNRILAACPKPDIIVTTCSPPTVTGDFRKITNDDWRATMELTFLSPVQYMKACVDGMIERGFGRIVNIATVAAKSPSEVRLLSGAPRAALVNYSVALAKKVAKHNVAINNMLPGMYHTATIHDRYTQLAANNGTTYDEEIAAYAKRIRIPTRTFGQPDDFGVFCALLCSQQANYTIGQSIVMDGGVTNNTF